MSAPPAAAAKPNRRQAARLAAVQALYQWQEGEHGSAEIIDQFLSVRRSEAGEGGMRRDADQPLFRDVVGGAGSNSTDLELMLRGALGHDWTWGRRRGSARAPPCAPRCPRRRP